MKRSGRRIAFMLIMALILSSVYALPVDAASKPDLKKANVKWDLKKNKKIKVKTKWSVLGVKEHTVKMTNFKVKKAKKKGYKQCTFTLTFNRKINPTKAQVQEMFFIADGSNGGVNAPFGGGFYFTVVDYKTGKCLEGKNNKNVKVTHSKWKHTNKETKKGKEGFDIWYAKKATVKVKIIYPKNYKNLAIGVGGYTFAPYYKSTSNGKGGSSAAVTSYTLKPYFTGKKAFSKETKLYSKKSKMYAHFMRVK